MRTYLEKTHSHKKGWWSGSRCRPWAQIQIPQKKWKFIKVWFQTIVTTWFFFNLSPYGTWCPNFFILILGLVSHVHFVTHFSTAVPGMEESANITNTLTFSVFTLSVTFAWGIYIGYSPQNLQPEYPVHSRAEYTSKLIKCCMIEWNYRGIEVSALTRYVLRTLFPLFVA
jgi:hypothetical protein